MITITHCPVCNSNKLQTEMSCKDFFQSQENFSLSLCLTCQFMFTNPRPGDSELGKYYKSENYISHTNTKQGLVSKLYHLVRGYTLSQKVKLVSRYVSRGTVLDYGCGTGMFLGACKRAGFDPVGVEPDSGARSLAVNLGLKIFDAKESLPPDTKFDVITLWHVLEHVSDLNDTVTLLSSHLKDQGTVIIAVPNHKSWDATYYGSFWAAYDVPRHLYHFDQSSLESLMGKHSFELLRCLPMKFDSFYVSMLSEKYRAGEINYLRAFWIGLKSNINAVRTSEYSSLIYVFKKR